MQSKRFIVLCLCVHLVTSQNKIDSGKRWCQGKICVPFLFHLEVDPTSTYIYVIREREGREMRERGGEREIRHRRCPALQRP